MNSSGDEDDDRFFESLDRIPSTSESETEEESGEFGQKSVGNGNGRAFIRPPDYSKYEIWKGEPGSVQERRERLLRELGLRNGGDPRPDSNANLRRVQFAEIRPASAIVDVGRSASGEEFAGRGEESWSEGTNLAIIETDSNSADGRINFDGKENNLANSTGIGADEQRKSSLYLSSGDFSREVGERRGGVISSADNSSGELIVKIKNLDNGKEFVVNELGENGMWNKLKELDTGRQLSLEEFDRVVGHSPLVQELMKRENGEFSGRESPDLRGGGKGKKKAGWLRTIKDVAQTMRAVNKDKKSSDERDTSSEKGGRRSSSATDDSQEILLHMPKKTKVWHYGKSDKEFSGLFMGQEIQAHQGSIWVLRFSSDGRYLASGGQDRIVHVWQVIESKQKQDTPAQKSDDNASNTYVTANGSTELVSLNIDSAVDKKKKGLFLSGRKSSATSTDCICLPEIMFLLSEKPLCSFHGHLDDVLDLSWSQSQYLLSSSMDKTVRLWHMSYKSCLKVFSHNDYVTCIQFNPIDDRFFISGSLDKKVRIWSIPDRKVVDWTDIYEMVTAACYTPDGQRALVGTHKGNCLSYTTSGNRLQEEKQIEVQKKKKKSRGKKITGFQFAPGNNRKVLITSADSRIRIFDDAELVQTFKGFRNTTSQICASFTTNGKYIVSASEDSYVYIWKDDIPSNPAAKNQGSCRSYEYFLSRKVSTAIPWQGMKCESLASSPREIISVEGPESLLQGSGNAGRKSTSFSQGSTSQGYDVTLYNPSRSQISGNSEIQMVERNGGILEGEKFRDRSEGSSRETMNQDVFLTCNNRLSAAGSLRPSLSAFSDSQRVVDQSSPNHGLFLDSMSKGSATWPEEKLPAFTIQNLNLAASESSNSNYESRDGSSIQDQSIHASCGSVIVSASLSGELRTFQNYGCPVHL